MVFQDFSIEAMATTYPVTIEELKLVPGVGEGKAKKFGQEFVDLIKKYVDENEIERPDDFRMRAIPKNNKKITLIQGIDNKKSLESLAESLGLTHDEMLSELEGIVYNGWKINIDYYIREKIDEDIIQDIYDYFCNCEEDNLSKAIEELGQDDYTEEEVRLVRIKFLSEMGN